MWICKHCSIEYDLTSTSAKANHTRWCDKNPKLDLYKQNTSIAVEAMRLAKERSGIYNQFLKAKESGEELLVRQETRLKLSKSSKGRRHTHQTKEVIREKALKSNHRRIRKSTRRYIKKDGSIVLLDSSWEEALAIRLDKLGVIWTRPDPVKYIGADGLTHNYFPDFYLPDHDLYLDPKNPVVYNQSIRKFEQIRLVLPNLRILRSLDECNDFVI